MCDFYNHKFFRQLFLSASRAKATLSQQKESNNINVSLMQLWRCLQAIRKNSPDSTLIYRDSKLTHLLMPSLCRTGLSHVAMIACVNPHANDYDETLTVLGKPLFAILNFFDNRLCTQILYFLLQLKIHFRHIMFQ